MPAKSQAQRGYLAHKFGPEWMKRHHFDNPGKLPEKVHAQAGKTNVGLALFKAMQSKSKNRNASRA
jgi:hypothetical protein